MSDPPFDREWILVELDPCEDGTFESVAWVQSGGESDLPPLDGGSLRVPLTVVIDFQPHAFRAEVLGYFRTAREALDQCSRDLPRSSVFVGPHRVLSPEELLGRVDARWDKSVALGLATQCVYASPSERVLRMFGGGMVLLEVGVPIRTTFHGSRFQTTKTLGVADLHTLRLRWRVEFFVDYETDAASSSGGRLALRFTSASS